MVKHLLPLALLFITVSQAAFSAGAFAGVPVSSSQGGGTPAGGARAYFTDLPLVTQEGKTVRFFSDVLENRVVLISGFYTECRTVSPRQNLALSRLQDLLGDRLGRDVRMISITIDPLRDTPERLAPYARVFHPRPGWVFLSGKPENVNWVNYRLGQYTEDIETHPGVYLLGNTRTGLWMKVSPQASTQDLHRQIEKLLKDGGDTP